MKSNSVTMKNRLNRWLVALFWLLGIGAAAQAVPAFHGAEGGGAKSVGGRGGAVLHVTNLNNDGPGSFRAACEATGPRIVIFRTGGSITLDRPINITNPYITIAGQTAPGGGILLGTAKGECDAIVVHTHDVVIRFLRVRNAHDGFGAKGASNLIIDHCSVSWGRDENMSANAPTHDVTYSWILNAECLMPHACGILIGGAGWDPVLSPRMLNIDVHHNLFMHNLNRNPKIKCMNSQAINNITYDWNWWAAAFAGGMEIDWIGNLYKTGPNFIGVNVEHCCGFLASPREILWRADYTTGPPNRDPSIYIRGNMGPSNPRPSADNWSMMEVVNPGWVRTEREPTRRFERLKPQSRAHPITVHPVEKLEEVLLGDVGASRRLDEDGNWVMNRDSVDERLVREYRDGSGKLVYDIMDVGGFPTMAKGTPYADADGDGMPDRWEKARGLSPTVNDSAADRDGDGYTNIEEFLNGSTKIEGASPANAVKKK
jgi:pectate lyase